MPDETDWQQYAKDFLNPDQTAMQRRVEEAMAVGGEEPDYKALYERAMVHVEDQAETIRRLLEPTPEPPRGGNHALLIGGVAAIAAMEAPGDFHGGGVSYALAKRLVESETPTDVFLVTDDDGNYLDTIFIDRPSGRWAVKVIPVAVREF